MPLLKIQTNVECSADTRGEILSRVSAAVAEMLGKPERYVMISLDVNPDMVFAGEGTPLAYLELKSIGFPAEHTGAFSATLCRLMADHFNVAPERVYIEFADAARHLWGWNGATF